MLNAVEHGNLDIRYQDKTRLIMEGRWEKEIAQRLNDPRYGTKLASAHYRRTPELHEVTIEDEGNGSPFADFLELSPSRAADPHAWDLLRAHDEL